MDKRKGKKVEKGDLLQATINKMQIANGNIIIYAKLV